MRGIRLDSGFPLLAAPVNRNGAFYVTFAKAAVLRNNDGRATVVGPKLLGIVPEHSSHIAQYVGREDVLIRERSHGFRNAPVLPLARPFLNEFIGHAEPREFVPQA